MPTFKKNVLGGLPFTTIPDYFLAEVMTRLSHSELRVMLYIFLHTVGYGKLADAISYDQFLSGIVTRDGRRLDHGAGVKRRALVDALYSLEHEHGLITRSHDGFSMLATIHLQLPSEGPGSIFKDNDTTAPETRTNQALGEVAQRAKAKPHLTTIASRENEKKAESDRVQSLHLDASPSQKRYPRKLGAKGQKAKQVKSQILADSLAPCAGASIHGRPDWKDQGGKETFNQVQILPTPSSNQVQTLHSTRESSLNHENHKNRVAAAGLFARGKTDKAEAKLETATPIKANQIKPEFGVATSAIGGGKEHEEAVKLLVDNVVGISMSEAQKLVGLAFSPGRRRDLAYLKRLVEYITTCEQIRTPAAVLTTLIQTDQDRTPAWWGSRHSTSGEKGRGISGQSKGRGRERSHDFSLDKYTYPTNVRINNSQGSKDYSDHTNTNRHGDLEIDSPADAYVREDVTLEALVNSAPILDGSQPGGGEVHGACGRVAVGEVWKVVQEDLAGRYHLGDTTLRLLEGSRLEVCSHKMQVMLGSIWQERELGLAARSAIGLALRQRLGMGYELAFTSLAGKAFD